MSKHAARILPNLGLLLRDICCTVVQRHDSARWMLVCRHWGRAAVCSKCNSSSPRPQLFWHSWHTTYSVNSWTACLLRLFETFPFKEVGLQRGAMCACITCCLSFIACIKQLVTALYSVAFGCCEEASWRSSECMNGSTTYAGTWTRESWWSREWEWTKYVLSILWQS